MPRWYRFAAVVVSLLVLGIASVSWTAYVDHRRAAAERESDRRWCDLLSTLDEAYSSTPPSTDLGRRVADAIHSLRVDLDC